MGIQRLVAITVLVGGFLWASYPLSATQGQETPAALLERVAQLQAAKNYEEAIPLAERAVALLERQADQAQLAVALNKLGNLKYSAGKYQDAADAFEREVKIRRSIRPADDRATAIALGNLGNLKRQLNQLVEAENLLRDGAALLEKALGPDAIEVANSLINLGSFLNTKGDRESAADALQRARRAYETQNQTDTRNYSVLLNNLGQLYSATGALEKAQATFRDGLAIREKLDMKGAELAIAVEGLAQADQELGDFAAAEPLHRRALQLFESDKSARQSDVSGAVVNLATIKSLQGDAAEADSMFLRALAMRESTMGSQSPVIAKTLEQLAVSYQLTNRPTDAVTAMVRSTDVYESNVRSILTSGSEQSRLNYMNTLQENTDIALSLRSSIARPDPVSTTWAASLVLRRKGRVLEAMATTMDRLSARVTDDDRRQLEALAKVRGELATLALQTSGAADGAREKAFADRMRQADDIERSLATSSRTLATELQAVDVASIQRVLPDDTVLIEYVLYRPFNLHVIGRKGRFDTPRYAAFTLRHTGSPVWFELGSADEIDRLAMNLRTEISAPTAGHAKLASRALSKNVLDPIERELKTARRILIATDGQLSIVPFSALQDTEGRFLVERAEIGMLASGRDLLRLADHQPSRGPDWIIANPDFDAGTGPAAPRHFPPLPGTGVEATALHALLPAARVATGREATETLLKHVTGPRMLHIATHGFFLDAASLNLPGPPDARGVPVTQAPPPESAARSALLQSGLALAGANRPSTAGDDGILTALEAAGLDLHGTQLVVLSACETGLGQVRSGEGVFGLRRALAVAGAESLVISLWEVDDQATSDLMKSFYTRLGRGDGRAVALRTVQLDFLKSRQWSDPYYWAAFALSGDWTALRAK